MSPYNLSLQTYNIYLNNMQLCLRKAYLIFFSLVAGNLQGDQFITNKIKGGYRCIIWPSIARITATLMIFIFHYYSIQYNKILPIDVPAILIFCFLTGYLINQNVANKRQWIAKHYLKIMVPFWVVMFFVLLANYFVTYKHVFIANTFIVLLGGGLFVSEKLYVISWYITLVLLQYLFFLCLLSVTGYLYKLGIILISFCIFHYIVNMDWYYIATLIGYYSKFFKKTFFPQKINNSKSKICKILFLIQQFCYCFFLTHGGILLLCHNVLDINNSILLLSISFTITCISTIICKQISDIILLRYI